MRARGCFAGRFAGAEVAIASTYPADTRQPSTTGDRSCPWFLQRRDYVLGHDTVGDAPSQTAAAPDAVRLAVAREYPRGEIVASAVERHTDGDAWRVRVKDRLTSRDLVVDPGGGVLAQAEDVPVGATPDHIQQAVARQFGSPALWHVQHFSGVGEEAWLVTFSRGSRFGRALFDAEGRLVRGEYDPATVDPAHRRPSRA